MRASYREMGRRKGGGEEGGEVQRGGGCEACCAETCGLARRDRLGP